LKTASVKANVNGAFAWNALNTKPTCRAGALLLSSPKTAWSLAHWSATARKGSPKLNDYSESI
jgi:hypothetical protein